MGYQNQTFDLIKAMTGQANILTVPVEFIHFTGDMETALFLSQIVYWTGRQQDQDGWIYKTYQDWETELTLNEYKIRKASKKLKDLGILKTKIKKCPKGNPTVHYRMETAVFSETFLQFLKERNNKISSNEPLKNEETSIAEITTEITTETTTESMSPQKATTPAPQETNQELETEQEQTTPPYKKIIQLYNDTCVSLPKVVEITDQRKRRIKTQWLKYSELAWFEELFKKAEESDFLTGRTERPWLGCSFDWIVKPANITKIFEGNYCNDRGTEVKRQKKISKHTKVPNDKYASLY